MTDTVDRLKSEMHARFGVNPDDVRIVRSPYRICPLGAHIDHQLGPVTAMAIDRAVHLAYVPSGSPEMRLQSLAFEGEVRFSLDEIAPRQDGDWGNFPRGAVQALRQDHTLKEGLIGLTEGRMGEGGLSSSAAIGVAYLLALEDINGLTVTPEDNIRLDQAIENGYLGLKNGILDQSAILLSRRDSLTLIDCETVTHQLIPKAPTMSPFTILIAFSGLRQALVTTGYNTRVEECAEAATTLLKASGRPDERPLLGNVTPETYAEHKDKLSGPPAKRAEHFFTESARVHKGVDAWRSGNLEAFGHLIAQSGHSSIHNYECGSDPLIALYHILIETEGVYGARFSGGGFRGCCIALANPDRAEAAVDRVRNAYTQEYPDLVQNAPISTCQPDDGARIL